MTAVDTPGERAPQPRTFAEFWPHYVAAHTDRRCRALHYAGAVAALGCAAWAALSADWRPLLLAPVLGYGLAWVGHFCAEGNRPAGWRYPAWSLLGEGRMCFLALTRRMHLEVAQLGSRRR